MPKREPGLTGTEPRLDVVYVFGNNEERKKIRDICKHRVMNVCTNECFNTDGCDIFYIVY